MCERSDVPAIVAGLLPALGGMVALASALGIGRFVYTPIMPAMTEALGLTKIEAGPIASASFNGTFTGAVVGLAAAVAWGAALSARYGKT